MSDWYWVRHGPTHQKCFTGWRDVPADLSDRAALQRLSALLPGDAVVVSSDLVRAVSTADAIAGGRERLPHRPGLREFDFGDWDGMHFSDVAEAHPELSRLYWEEPGLPAPPNGESWDVAAARVSACVAELAEVVRGRPVVVVAHLGVILTRIAAASGRPAVEVIGQNIRPLSVTRIGPAGVDLVDHLA